MIDKIDDLSENKTNIVVGRFQSPTLTEDQKNLLDYSLSTSRTHPTVVLGLSPLKCTAANPLDYEARKAMIEAGKVEAILALPNKLFSNAPSNFRINTAGSLTNSGLLLNSAMLL